MYTFVAQDVMQWRGRTVVNMRWLVSGLLSVFLLGATATARAATVSDWNFDPNRNQLNFTTDEEVEPRVQLLVNPTRLVIDLPGIVLGHSLTRESVGSVVQEVRIGQFDRYTTRLVVALAPGYTLDPNQVQVRAQSPTRWSIQLPSPQPASSDALLQAASSDSQAIPVTVPELPPPFAPGTMFASSIRLGVPLSDLRYQVRALMAQYNFLSTGMFFVDLDTGNYLDMGGDRVFPAASTIKLPILIAFFQDLDAGKINLNDTLVMRRDLVTGGSGDLQDRPVGTKLSALETVNKMITISDNTATNMVIDYLGGIDYLNQRFRSWGLKDTVIRNWLADLQGTNTTSSQDLVQLLAMVVNNNLLSASSREQVLDILRHTTVRSLLPAGLGPGADIANKTGDIGFLIGDAGLITMPSGKRYLAGIFVERPYDDPRGRDFIQQVSRLVYSYLNQTGAVTSSSQ
jgi:beta-lactamase class A